MKVKLLSHTQNPEKIVAVSAKLCYAGCTIDELEDNLTEEQIAKFVNMLMKIGHESPLEHASFTFAVEGVSRVTEQQLTRHRIASYSIQSGRYVSRDNASFYCPEDIENNSESKELYEGFCELSKETYNKITEELLMQYVYDFLMKKADLYSEDIRGNKSLMTEIMETNYKKEYNAFKKRAIENARMVFPNSLETKIIFTMNLRTLINFFDHRCCFRAQDEIRELANEMLKICRKNFPLLFNKLGASCRKGYCPEGNMQCSQLKGKIPTLEELFVSHTKIKQNSK